MSFGGTSPQNTATVTLTLFALGEDPPQNVTLQGSHGFNNGDEIGSVTGASGDYTMLVGGTFSISSNSLTIDF